MTNVSDATLKDVRRARRAAVRATRRYASVLAMCAHGCPQPPEILEELEVASRLKRASYDELRRRYRDEQWSWWARHITARRLRW